VPGLRGGQLVLVTLELDGSGRVVVALAASRG
jgi:hypothetical protein